LPTVLKPRIYAATFEAARGLLKRGILPIQIPLTVNSTLFHYNGAKYGVASQHEEASRAFFRAGNEDTGNRWSGQASEPSYPSFAGLYMVREAPKQGTTSTEEMEHYMDKFGSTINPEFANQGMHENSYFTFSAGNKAAPSVQAMKAMVLYFNFKYEVTEEITLFDLRVPYSDLDPSSFVAKVFRTMLSNDRSLMTDMLLGRISARRLYTDSEDASFCRAIGNACLDHVACDGIQVNSVRDLNGVNVILKQPADVPLSSPSIAKEGRLANINPVPWLKFVGRTSFFKNEVKGKVLYAAETMADSDYNTTHWSLRPMTNARRLDAHRTPLRSAGEYSGTLE